MRKNRPFRCCCAPDGPPAPADWHPVTGFEGFDAQEPTVSVLLCARWAPGARPVQGPLSRVGPAMVVPSLKVTPSRARS